MILKKTFLACALAFICCFINAQSAINIEQKLIPCMLPLINSNKIIPLPNNNFAKGWYPKKAEFYKFNEFDIAGYLYYELGQNGLLDKAILVYKPYQGSYDSVIYILNKTPYTKGKNIEDTVYFYTKKLDGSCMLNSRTTLSYHYYDHFDGDSLFYEYIVHKWDDYNKQWIKNYRWKIGFHDTLVQFINRNEVYRGGPNNTWEPYIYIYDSITYDNRGFVDSLYRLYLDDHGVINCISKCGFTNDEQGKYTKITHFYKINNTWEQQLHGLHNITWKEWNGFTYWDDYSIGAETITPYKRTKIDSTSGFRRYWDIDGTKSNNTFFYDTINGKLYLAEVVGYFYNEYGDFTEYRLESYTYPDESGNQELWSCDTYHISYTYDEINGLIESKHYGYNKINGGIMDTVFWTGQKYIEFYASIPEFEQNIKQVLSIVPNPVSGFVTILCTASEIRQLNIYNNAGKIVKKIYPKSNQTTFDVSILPKGIYLVQALLKNGETQTGKLVVK